MKQESTKCAFAGMGTAILLGLFWVAGWAASASAADAGMTKAQPTETPRFFYKGLLISDSTIAGEQKKDGRCPFNATCCRLSKNRYIWVYNINAFRGVDAVGTIIYQIRQDVPDGPVLTEGILSKAIDDWDLFNRGDKYFKQQGSQSVFGVPLGATGADGKLLPANNLFCASWYVFPRIIEPKTGRLVNTDLEKGYEKIAAELNSKLRIHCVQFRLNETQNDIELLTPIIELRQKGYEQGDAFCELGTNVLTVNQWYTPFQPANEQCTQWANIFTFSTKLPPSTSQVQQVQDRIAGVMMEYNAQTSRYEWVKTGPLGTVRQWEASLIKSNDTWIISTRGGGWRKTKDIFTDLGELKYATEGLPHANSSAYLCGDGVIRVFGGNNKTSPFKWVRNPQYCWDVNPDTFALSNCKTVMGSDDIGIPVTGPASVVMRVFLSPVFNNMQIATVPFVRLLNATPKPKELEMYGVHYFYVTYDKDIKEEWRFENDLKVQEQNQALTVFPLKNIWKFKPDAKNEGQKEDWASPAVKDADWADVRSDTGTGWEKQGFPDYTGYGWYRQTLRLPPEILARKHLYLIFGAVDEDAEIYLDGKLVFSHTCESQKLTPNEIWKKPFMFDTKPTGLLKADTDILLAVRVYNSAFAGGVYKPVAVVGLDHPVTTEELFDYLTEKAGWK